MVSVLVDVDMFGSVQRLFEEMVVVGRKRALWPVGPLYVEGNGVRFTARFINH